MVRRPVVIINGEYAELPAADSLGGAAAPSGGTVTTQISLTFGPIAKYQQTFTVTDANAVTTNRVMIFVTPDSDEYEMDAISCTAYVSAPGVITVFACANPGPVIGTRLFAYTLY
jgi:hypothetical protein